MDNLALVLEQELEDAVEVKNPKSLHRYILLLTDNLVKKDQFENNITELKSDVRLVVESMKQGFAAMDKRFEDMNKRFDDVNSRFDDVNSRFDDVNLRFEDVNQRFEDTNLRFEDTNLRFEDSNKRFDDMNHRFGDMAKRSSRSFTYMNLMLGTLVLITVLFKFI